MTSMDAHDLTLFQVRFHASITLSHRFRTHARTAYSVTLDGHQTCRRTEVRTDCRLCLVMLMCTDRARKQTDRFCPPQASAPGSCSACAQMWPSGRPWPGRSPERRTGQTWRPCSRRWRSRPPRGRARSSCPSCRSADRCPWWHMHAHNGDPCCHVIDWGPYELLVRCFQ